MRLDHFLPFFRKPRPGTPPPPPGRVGRWARRLLPATFFSDRTTLRVGWLRRSLRRIGPSWQSAPVRRVVQAGCFVAFLVLFCHVCWPYGGTDYAQVRTQREWIEAEAFLALDPLVSLSTAVAGRAWVWSLTWAAGILLFGVLVPRGFCGYLCPLGTLIDAFDWAIGRRVTRFRIQRDGAWVHAKYALLLACMLAAAGGLLLTGFFAAIPVLTRACLFLITPFQLAAERGWYQVPPMHAGHVLSILLFLAVLALGLLRPRFWCRYVCPTGATLSLGNLLRGTERKVEASCVHCNRCIEVCPFDAIKADFTTRTMDCTLCQTCGGVCPTHAIKFVGRWNTADLKPVNVPALHEVPVSRRGFLAAAVSGTAAAWGVPTGWGAGVDDPTPPRPIRPPGSVPERDFLQMCIRCGECFAACPNSVLQPMGFEQGLEGLWTPRAVPSWSGCDSTCNNCGQVCPTGAIRALPIEEKRVARMGLAIVDTTACLPFAGREACQLCVDECHHAGYDAIEFLRVGTQADDEGMPVEGSGLLAPVVLADKCVGCGLCQTRCSAVNFVQKGLLSDTAIRVEAGDGREDRLHAGSYRALRDQERQARAAEADRLQQETGGGDGYLPDTMTEGR